jgi:hypothetical protein
MVFEAPAPYGLPPTDGVRECRTLGPTSCRWCALWPPNQWGLVAAQGVLGYRTPSPRGYHV